MPEDTKADQAIERPDFVRDLLADWGEAWERRRWLGLLPWKILICAIPSSPIAYFMPVEFWSATPGIARNAFFASLVTVNGLLLALGWNSFAKMYELCASGAFSGYLQSKGMVRHYLFLIDYIQIVLIAAITITVAGFIVTLFDTPPLWSQRIGLGITIWSTGYALAYATGGVRMVRDLVWYRAQGETAGLFSPESAPAANVHRLPDRG